MSGVLQLQQVTHFTDGPQRLAEEQGGMLFNLNPKTDYSCQLKLSEDNQTIKKKHTLKITHIAEL